MIIRKKYRFEAAHIVRDCSSKMCKENIHGHSYIVEVFISGKHLDHGCMILDFSKLAKVKELINSFDHSYCMWDKESASVKKAMQSINRRTVTMPISPSAEGFALMFFVMIRALLSELSYDNGEGEVKLHSVRVHETESGYAEAFEEDLAMAHFTPKEVIFSEGIKEEWHLLGQH